MKREEFNLQEEEKNIRWLVPYRAAAAVLSHFTPTAILAMVAAASVQEVFEHISSMIKEATASDSDKPRH